MTPRLFAPRGNVQLTLVAATADRVALPGDATGEGMLNVRVCNPAMVPLFVKTGNSSVTALSDGTSYVIMPNSESWFEVDGGHTHISGICAAAVTFYVSRGKGI